MNRKNLLQIVILGLVAPMLASCLGGLLEPKSDPTVFYMMRPIAPAEKISIKEKVTLNLMPINAPSYMSRNQIVTLDANASVKLSEFDRWAESTQSGFTRVIVENIAELSDNIDVYAYPTVSPDALNLKIFIYDCIGTLGGDLLFKGKWQLDSISTDRHTAKDFSLKIPCGSTYASYVQAINKCLEMLSVDIVKSISEQYK